jgi:nucleoside-diphosphate-sugar epimerase
MAVCLVTGGAGFIGSHLVEALVAQGHAVRVLDNLSTGKLSNLQRVAGEIELTEGTVTDPTVVDRAVDGAEWVFHHAALPSVPRSMQEPLAAHHACATGTLLLLLAARDAGVRRFVYAASACAYGDAGKQPRREDDPPRPLSPYAAAALAGERYCEIFARMYGLETVRLRYFNVYGPRQAADGDYAAAVPRFLHAMRAGRSPVICGDGFQSRDFTYVDDVVQANLLAAQASRVAGKVYNIAYGGRTSLLDLVALLNDLLGTAITPIHAAPRPGDVRHSVADTSRAQAELGYCPCTSVKEGLARCLAYLGEAGRPVAAPCGAFPGPHPYLFTEEGSAVPLPD